MYIKIDGADINNFKNKKIILFGASSTGTKALEEFENTGAVIIGFSDNSVDKHGTKFCGYTVYPPGTVKTMAEDDPELSVMVTSTYDKEISAQLKEMGIKNVFIVKMGVLHDKMPFTRFSNTILDKDTANKKITELINSSKPFFIGRIGSTELETICNYAYFTKRISGQGVPYTNNITGMLCDWCGFFPPDHMLIDLFCKLYLEKIKEADLLWCMWQSKYENKLYQDYCPDTELSLYDETGFPLYEQVPWTSALKGKKVLVIHPFEKSVQINYKQKDRLFSNKNFMPDFELITIKAVQTLADNKNVQYSNWFEALDSMKEQMSETDFDIALVGAGAYGFPLGAYAKELGRQALHIGGMLQLYFGIRGQYYDQFNYHNEFWTRPLEEEKPKGFKKVEAGRYW